MPWVSWHASPRRLRSLRRRIGWASPSDRGGQAGRYRSFAAIAPREACLYFPLPPFRPSAGGAGPLCPLLTSAPRSGRLTTAPVPEDTAQISWGNPGVLHRAPAGFTALALDGYGLCDFLPARPTSPASYPISVRRVATLLHASFRRSLAVPPLRFASASPPSGCTGDSHPQDAGHAQHTGSRFARPPPAATLRVVLDFERLPRLAPPCKQ